MSCSRHTIQSGVWHTYSLRHPASNVSSRDGTATIAQALHDWLQASSTTGGGSVTYHDQCSGAHCNARCPDLISLGEMVEYWGLTPRVVLLGLVAGVALVCLAAKTGLYVCEVRLRRQQEEYLQWKGCQITMDTESTVRCIHKVMMCISCVIHVCYG